MGLTDVKAGAHNDVKPGLLRDAAKRLGVAADTGKRGIHHRIATRITKSCKLLGLHVLIHKEEVVLQRIAVTAEDTEVPHL